MCRDLPGLRIGSIFQGVTSIGSGRSCTGAPTAGRDDSLCPGQEEGWWQQVLVQSLRSDLLQTHLVLQMFFISALQRWQVIKKNGNDLNQRKFLALLMCPELLGCRRAIPEHGKSLRELLAFQSSIICKSIRDGSGMDCAWINNLDALITVFTDCSMIALGNHWQ